MKKTKTPFRDPAWFKRSLYFPLRTYFWISPCIPPVTVFSLHTSFSWRCLPLDQTLRDFLTDPAFPLWVPSSLKHWCLPVSQHSHILVLPQSHSASVTQATSRMVESPRHTFVLSCSVVFRWLPTVYRHLLDVTHIHDPTLVRKQA